MDTAQWPHQEIVLKPMEEVIVAPNSTTTPPTTKHHHHQHQQNSNGNLEKKLATPQKEQAINCPRCNSTNTKFCYYNNYSLSQPRYFCKTCRRYWTEGGSLRNIPVGGGSRKTKRSSSSTSNNNNSSSTSSLSSPSKKLHHQLPDLILPSMSLSASHLSHQNPNGISKIINLDHGQDLNLGFSHDFKTISELIQVPNFDQHHNNGTVNGKEFSTTSSASTTANSTNGGHLSALELLTRGGLNSFLPSIPAGSSVFPGSSTGMFLPEFKPSSLSFSLDGLGMGSNSLHGSNVQGHQSNSGRLLFPFEDLKQVSTTSSNTSAGENRDHHGGGGNMTGYWSGILGGGGGGGVSGAGGGGGSW